MENVVYLDVRDYLAKSDVLLIGEDVLEVVDSETFLALASNERGKVCNNKNVVVLGAINLGHFISIDFTASGSMHYVVIDVSFELHHSVKNRYEND